MWDGNAIVVRVFSQGKQMLRDSQCTTMRSCGAVLPGLAYRSDARPRYSTITRNGYPLTALGNMAP